MKSRLGFALTSLILSQLPGYAWAFTPDSFSAVPQPNGDSGVSFSIGYTFGVHVGKAGQATGSVQAQLDPLLLSSGDIVVPIASMTTGDPTRDCHMREALGIDYSHSHFPTDHVCVNDQIPATGPDSVAFPEIRIKLVDMKPLDGNTPASSLRVVAGQTTDVNATLQLTIHGITQTTQSPVRLSLDASGRVQAQAQVSINIKDYGIVVKPAGPIKSKDIATVTLNLLLAKQASR
jgi:polyisoprenoid-binding protein YceI